jgi:lipopolysaccharide/colanic/teichoic acid biosynthesis glycosyltransferase
MTGWAQVNQPHSGTVEDARRKLELDLHYLQHWSPLLDVRILARTARILCFGWGRSASAPP